MRVTIRYDTQGVFLVHLHAKLMQINATRVQNIISHKDIVFIMHETSQCNIVKQTRVTRSNC